LVKNQRKSKNPIQDALEILSWFRKHKKEGQIPKRGRNLELDHEEELELKNSKLLYQLLSSEEDEKLPF